MTIYTDKWLWLNKRVHQTTLKITKLTLCGRWVLAVYWISERKRR